MNAPCPLLRTLALLSLAGCTSSSVAIPFVSQAGSQPLHLGNALPAHAIIGFSVDTPQRVAIAAKQGVTTTILYSGSPTPNSALAKALQAGGVNVIDGSLSGYLFYWECHRTHTVAPPPKSYGKNSYCSTDEDPRFDSDAAVLRAVRAQLARDAKRPYVVGYWVLDDWPWWDSGSGRTLVQSVHALIAAKAPGRPAICGFGAGIGRGHHYFWDPGTGKNYSNAGCDVVGWYNYSSFGRTRPSMGTFLNWSMTGLLAAMGHTLANYGWNIAQTPLYGIGQAWAGSYDGPYYQPGLTVAEMQTQAAAFCRFGAKYVGWYAWDDSGYNARTQTPDDSATIGAGIGAGIDACKQIWKG
ncbi:MAG: hypothetical protein JO199_14385 [Candidatus Eremiobacteraeota bacterium]|nr:hypothetical protein [Candidatus Eremiobacteraeota bacterium]